MYGLDVLGLAKYPQIIEGWPASMAAGVFANTFGNVFPVIRKLLASDRCPLVRIHAVWQDDHNYVPKRDDPVIFDTLKKAKQVQALFPHVTVQFSPFCEHNIDGVQFRTLWDRLRDQSGSLQLVNSPWKGYLAPPAWGVINEIHGSKGNPSGPYQYSFDGLSAVDADVSMYKERHKSAEVFFFWVPQFNGRKTTKDTTPRPERKAWPTKELTESVAYLATDRGLVNLPRRWLWKSHAEQHTVPPAPRELKPVMLSPRKVEGFKLIDSLGGVRAESGPALPYEDGRFRYYWSKYGYQFVTKKDHVLTLVQNDGTRIGTLNPGFRLGEFRNVE